MAGESFEVASESGDFIGDDGLKARGRNRVGFGSVSDSSLTTILIFSVIAVGAYYFIGKSTGKKAKYPINKKGKK